MCACYPLSVFMSRLHVLLLCSLSFRTSTPGALVTLLCLHFSEQRSIQTQFSLHQHSDAQELTAGKYLRALMSPCLNDKQKKDYLYYYFYQEAEALQGFFMKIRDIKVKLWVSLQLENPSLEDWNTTEIRLEKVSLCVCVCV